MSKTSYQFLVAGVLALVSASGIFAQTVSETRPVLPTTIIAKQVSVDDSLPNAPKMTWRVIGVLQKGSDPVNVGDDLVQLNYPDTWASVDPKKLAIFQLAKSPSGLKLQNGCTIYISDDPNQRADSIIERETRGMADVQALANLPTDMERATAFAKAAKELKMPSLSTTALIALRESRRLVR
jgi:hypothetical protein